MTPIRVAQVGLGPIGLAVTRQLAGRSGFDLIGAVDIAPDIQGDDLGTLCGLDDTLGVAVEPDLGEALKRLEPDIVVACTSSSLEAVATTLETCVGGGASVVSSTEQLAYPWRERPEISKRLHQAALEAEKTILGTGVNPGFAMDVLPLTLTAPCRRVDAVSVRRFQNAAKRRGPFQRKIGAGLTPAAFRERVEQGTLGHVGFAESIGMIAETLGWRLDRITDEIQPKIAEQAVASDVLDVEPGQVSGLIQLGVGYEGTRERIRLELQAYLGAPEDFDEVEIQGDPNLRSRVEGGFPGDIATASVLVNAIPRVVAAPPGLLTMKDLPPVYCWPGRG